MTEKVLLPAAAAKPQSPIKLVTLHRCWALAIICWVEYWTSLVFSFCPPSWFYPWFWDQFLMGLSWTWKIGFLSYFFLVLLMGKDIFVGTIYPLKMLILFCLNLMFVLYIYAIASFYMSLCFILLHTPFFVHALSFDFCWLCLSQASVTPWICGIKDRTYEKPPFCVQWRGCSS